MTDKINKLKVLNDPIYGLVSIPDTLIFDIIEHPYFQRLRRVTQMGLSNLVYPGCNHTRFHHALGCMYLMRKAIGSLRIKNIIISEEEEKGLCLAILLHDIGHGAFSHALEHSIVNGISHEDISIKFMKKLNTVFEGKLSLAIQIFEGKYHRKFFYQLISSQLDIDRLDYLKRDSFYTGVTEGNISSDRLIAMMNVSNDELVIEQKGIYSVENFIIARRLMYWQVYLHKTCVVAEKMLVKTLQRAKELVKKGESLFSSKAFSYFLHNHVTPDNFTDETLAVFSKLDDYDILSAVKEWTNHSDKLLATLATMLINRRLLKIEMQNHSFSKNYINEIAKKIKSKFNFDDNSVTYLLYQDTMTHQAYNPNLPIKILTKNNKLKDIVKASDQLNLEALSEPVIKYILCYPKDL